MAVLSNSTHCSSKKHAISNSSKLAAVALHNSRGYLSYSYDKSRVSDLSGNSETLVEDVKKYINDTFKKYIDDYNDKQKRKDRKIKTDAFEYFESNKKLDLAVEVIQQLGDQEYWSEYRQDVKVGKSKKGNDMYRHIFDKSVVPVMNDIYLKQAKAIESIYVDKKEVILKKVYSAFVTAKTTTAEIREKYPEEAKKFDEIIAIKKSSERNKAIKELGDDMRKIYETYRDAQEDFATISESRLIGRIQNDQMHLKLINQAAHYDEFSPHAHAVFVPYADGYEKGISTRIAKTVVLNKWSLEVIQDRMREIAEEEMAKHPELFDGDELKKKEKGRNYDYDKELLMTKNLREKEQQADQLEKDINEKSDLIENLNIELDELEYEDNIDKALETVKLKQKVLILEKENKELKETNRKLTACINVFIDFKKRVYEWIDAIFRWLTDNKAHKIAGAIKSSSQRDLTNKFDKEFEKQQDLLRQIELQYLVEKAREGIEKDQEKFK